MRCSSCADGCTGQHLTICIKAAITHVEERTIVEKSRRAESVGASESQTLEAGL